MRLGLAVGLLSGLATMACTTQIDRSPQNMDRFDEFGAADELESAPPRSDEPSSRSDETARDVNDAAGLEIIDGAIASTLPGLPNVDGAATNITFYEDSGWAEFDIMRSESAGAVMAIGYVDGGFNNPIFTEVGRVTRFVNGIAAGGNPEPVYLGVSACAGDSPYNWDIDEPADEVVVEVEEGEEPGEVVVVLNTQGPSGEMEVRMLLSK